MQNGCLFSELFSSGTHSCQFFHLYFLLFFLHFFVFGLFGQLLNLHSACDLFVLLKIEVAFVGVFLALQFGIRLLFGCLSEVT